MNVQKMSSEQARTEWRRLLDLASQEDVDVVIERHGKAIATVISYQAYRAIQSTLAEIRSGGAAKQRGLQMADILEQLAHLPERRKISHPLKWQIEERQDRPLPGRES